MVLSAAVLLLAPAPSRAAEEVRSGPLAAQAGPGGVVVTDADGDALPLAGVRVRRLGAWQDGGAVTAVARDGDGIAVAFASGAAARLTAAGDGAVRLAVRGPQGTEAVELAFARAPGERFLGFGERSDRVVREDGEVLNRVTEGPYQPAENPFLTAFVPPPGQNPRADATYYPVPWALSTRGLGVLVDGFADSTFALGSPWTVQAPGGELSVRVFAGPTPAAALRRFTGAVGRQPPAAAPWFFGPWFQPRGGDERVLDVLGRAGALGSVAQTYTHYLPCGDQQGREEAERARVARLHEAGLAVTTYFNPMVCQEYSRVFDEAERRGLLHRDATGRTLLYRYTGSTQFLVGQFDFTAPGAAEFFGDLLHEAVARDGHDGWMEDFGEYTPDEAVSHDGTPGPLMHNRYVDLYHGAAARYARERAGRPLARFNRSGWTGTAREAAIVWGGDPSTSWGFDGLESAVRNGLSMGLSGVSLWGSDIGGFFALSHPQTTPELLRRWIQAGFASGVMRTQSNGYDLGKPGRRAQVWDADVLPVWRRYARLRTQLQPYLAAAQREYDRTGLPMMRQLALAWPEDPVARSEMEYLFGGDLLVAPVVRPGQTERALRLPPGRWIDLWRSMDLREADAAPVLGRPRVLEGGRRAELPAPDEELPLLVREGALLALLPADVETLAPYGSGPGRRVRLADRAHRRTLLAWPARGVVARAEPADDARARHVLKRSGSWVLRVRQERRRRYDLQVALPAKPCRVRVGARTLPRRDWRYAGGVLRTSVRLGLRARVVATRPCR